MVKKRVVLKKVKKFSKNDLPEFEVLKVLEKELVHIKKRQKEKFSFEQVKVDYRRIEGWSPPSLFGAVEIKQLKVLENEAKLLRKKMKRGFSLDFPVIRPVRRELDARLFVKQQGNLDVVEREELKLLERKGKRVKERVLVVGPTSSMFEVKRVVLPPLWFARPKGLLKCILELEEKVEEGDFADAIDLYLVLNKQLQAEKDLSLVLRGEAFNRLLRVYRDIRDRFFIP